MAKNTGLGKGLGALLSNNVIEEESEEIQEGEVVRALKLIEVEPNKNQPRVTFDEEALEELSNSIKEYGVIQPIIVTKRENYYQIVAGERRWRASKKAGLTEIPAIVREYTEQTNREVALIENIQREDLNPIEKAMAIKELLEKYELTQNKLAEKLGMARSSLTNSLRVLNLEPRVIELAKGGKLTEGHCKALLAIEDPEKQYKSAVYMVESGDSVREAEKQMRIKKKSSKPNEDGRYQAIYREMEDTFRNYFGTKVKIDAGKRSGKIIIEYNTGDDLTRILGLIK
ncbi:MAG: ParB/RepB/Spo0J family partition protein [Oscillospiraceae bacterium]|nr:ParB/RepB/Spo0J family partition protein [Oscillospiraceae bacterium]